MAEEGKQIKLKTMTDIEREAYSNEVQLLRQRVSELEEQLRKATKLIFKLRKKYEKRRY